MIEHHIKSIKKILTKADLLLISTLILLSLLSFYFTNKKHDNAEVQIYSHNVLIHQLRLTEERQLIEISTGIKLEIKDMRIRLISSTCNKQICVDQGWTRNYPIICVPNELLIIIKSKKKDEEALIITS